MLIRLPHTTQMERNEMTNFDHIINWKLKAGSHKFPGPDGGTCINEAAIIAAGFEYKSVRSAEDCPPCFSRPISAYAICLNDRMPDDIRNKFLMPFITRLGGTTDTPEIEGKRAAFMIIQISRRMIAKQLSALSLPSEGFANAQTINGVRVAARDLARALALDLDLARALALARALDKKIRDSGFALMDRMVMLGMRTLERTQQDTASTLVEK